MQRLAVRALAGFLLAALPAFTVGASRGEVAAAAQAQDHPESKDQGACQAKGLNWRGFPYKVSNPAFKRTIYGGAFVSEAFRAEGFEGPVEGEDWDVLWTHKPQTQSLDALRLPPRGGRRLANHCHYFLAAGDKCAFARHARAASPGGPGSAAAGSLPSFELGHAGQLEQWRQAVRDDPGRYWLLKPCLGGASQGIRLLRGQDVLNAQQTFGPRAVAQQYLERPYMGFGGRKFHLRLYVLVTRWSPVSAHLYDEGLVFRSLHEHRAGGARSEAHDIFSSISKSVEALPLALLWKAVEEAAEARPGSAPPSAMVRGRIAESLSDLLRGPRAEASFGPFGQLEARRGYSCFDLLGADVLLDEGLRPWVMELNIGPNMWVDNHGAEHQEQLLATKRPLMEQTLRWAGLRSGSPPGTEEDADRQERSALVNFTRLL